MGEWADNFKCWEADAQPYDPKRFCGTCGANLPLENHELWCPNEPDRSAKDDTAFWLDQEADACDCVNCAQGSVVDDLQKEQEFRDMWLGEATYHAPEKPEEDWGLRNECLRGGTSAHMQGQTNSVDILPVGFTWEPVTVTVASTRAISLPTTAAERKTYPIASGVLDYFPDALVAIAHVSWKGNEQHNPGTPLHWDRTKSADEADTMLRHFLERGKLDVDGLSHTAKMAWRALALLQKEIEAGRA